MTITCSCGHKVNQIEQTHSVISKNYDRVGNPCLAYRTVCTTCYVAGDWVSDEELGYKWLTSDSETV